MVCWCRKVIQFKEKLGPTSGPETWSGAPKAQKPGKHFDLARKIFRLRSTKSPTRRSAKGELKPMMWKEIGKACGMSAKKVKKIYEQERLNVTVAFAKKLVARRRVTSGSPAK